MSARHLGRRLLLALAVLLALVGAASSQLGPIDTVVERASTVHERDLGSIALPRATNRLDVGHHLGGASSPVAILAAGAWAAVLIVLGAVAVGDRVPSGRRLVARPAVRGPPRPS